MKPVKTLLYTQNTLYREVRDEVAWDEQVVVWLVVAGPRWDDLQRHGMDAMWELLWQ